MLSGAEPPEAAHPTRESRRHRCLLAFPISMLGANLGSLPEPKLVAMLCQQLADQCEACLGVGAATGDRLSGGVLAGRNRRANSGPVGVVDTGGGAANVFSRWIGA